MHSMRLLLVAAIVAVFLGCETLPEESATTSTPPQNPFDELEPLVKRAHDAIDNEDSNLARYAEEKNSLLGTLFREGKPLLIELADTDEEQIERYVEQVDAESARTLCVVLSLEAYAQTRKQNLLTLVDAGEEWLRTRQLYEISETTEPYNEEDDVELFTLTVKLKDLLDELPEPPPRQIDGAILKSEVVRRAASERAQQREIAEQEARGKQEVEEERQHLKGTIATLDHQVTDVSLECSRLRDQLTGVLDENRRLRKQLESASEETNEARERLDELKNELAVEKQRASRLARHISQDSLQLQDTEWAVRTARKTTTHHYQTPLPMAPYGYWASPSGYRYGYGR